ncbi:MAG TPA: succinate dehydrogenase cytochrome b subunit [Vicinamibacterales bacterium]|nr:succinate dehydrogenase cytochrome b subunit [Vicinamibacterales bacterium]HPW20932.1 succinate dehydrogenase cytochrome b subunit [Vicinamibacterales bacterium]
MAPRRQYLFSTVATKVLIAIAGLSLVGFLCVHLAGNLLLYVGAPAFNAYSHVLISNPFIVPLELALLALFVLHVLEAVTMWWTDRAARPIAYQMTRSAGGRSRKSLASTTMIVTGPIVFVFVAVHVATMKYGPWYVADLHGTEARDLHRLVLETLRRPVWLAVYLPCLAAVGLHLWHGVSSAFESLGLHGPRLTPKVLVAGKALAVAIAAGFLSIPIWIFFFGGRS